MPQATAVNPMTNKIYVANNGWQCHGDRRRDRFDDRWMPGKILGDSGEPCDQQDLCGEYRQQNVTVIDGAANSTIRKRWDKSLCRSGKPGN